MIQEERNQICVARGGSQVKGADSTVRRFRVHAGAGLQEFLGDRGVSCPARDVEWCVQANSGHCLWVGSGVQQHVCHFGIAAFGRPVKGCHTITARCIHVGALLKQGTHGFAISSHGRICDRRVCSGGREQRSNRQCADECCRQEGPHRTNSPVLLPKLSMSAPSICNRLSITFAIGVPSGALMWRLPLRWPLAWPSNINGHRRWLWIFASAIGDPQMIIVLSSREASAS